MQPPCQTCFTPRKLMKTSSFPTVSYENYFKTINQHEINPITP